MVMGRLSHFQRHEQERYNSNNDKNDCPDSKRKNHCHIKLEVCFLLGSGSICPLLSIIVAENLTSNKANHHHLHQQQRPNSPTHLYQPDIRSPLNRNRLLRLILQHHAKLLLPVAVPASESPQLRPGLPPRRPLSNSPFVLFLALR